MNEIISTESGQQHKRTLIKAHMLYNNDYIFMYLCECECVCVCVCCLCVYTRELTYAC